MILDLKQVYISLVEDLHWMDRETKKATIDKVKSIHHLVSFPEWFLIPEEVEYLYRNVTLDEDRHLGNILTVIKFKNDEALLLFREPYFTDFSFDPLDINAYYSFYDNYICVPEGILRYPFYDLGLESLNYGALGVVLGHELSHGFDNIGRRYDKHGNLMKWWSDKAVDEYNSRAECYIHQYNNYTIPVLDAAVDGNLTLSENLADNGGIREAFMAYKKRLEALGGSEPKLPGFAHLSNEQLFFLAFANMWCAEYTVSSLLIQLLDEHSPNFVRVLMSLRNFPEFSKAWNCPVGSKMNPAKRCKLWID